MTGDGLPLKDRVERYREANPEASIPEIAGALKESPAAVSEALYEDTPESGVRLNTKSRDRVRGSRTRPRTELRTQFSKWSDANFAKPDSDVWPDELLEREQWMGHCEKKPFAPWGDRNAPAECNEDGHDTASTCDCDARWKWGYDGHYVDGETIAMAEVDPRLDGRAFLQQEDDPYVYVDGDDVRCPETGDVHPAFVAILEHLGLTYADVSQSGAGVHAIYRGDLPEGVKQASWQLDTKQWGENDDLPAIEVYPGKRVCVMTGEHVPGTPNEVRDWNDDVLDALLEANDEVATTNRDRAREELSTDPSEYDLDDYQPAATTATETTDDIRDIFAALDRVDARHVAEKTIVARWNDDVSTSDGHRAFWPTWGRNSNGRANIVNDRIWQDTGDLGGYGGPVVMALIDLGEMHPSSASPKRARGELWWRGIDHLRELGFDIPQYRSASRGEHGGRDEDLPPLLEDALDQDDDVDAEPTSTLPLKQLDALEPADRKRAARKRGLDWPSTDDAREQLLETIKQIIRQEDDRIVDAPTSLGKTFSVATTRWGAFDDVTGERPVVHLLETRKARDEAIEAADEHGGAYHVLRGRHEACPVCAGEHDPRAAAECDDVQVVTVDGEPASQVIDRLCEHKGLPFSVAHRFVADHNDQGLEFLPCGGDSCSAITQWDTYRDGPTGDGEHYWPLVIATHNFAYAPGLRAHNNIVVDELPDYRQELSTERVRTAVTAYLQEIDAPLSTWEDLVSLSQYDGYGDDAAAVRDELSSALNEEPEREWYLETEDAHILAPALARAVFNADDRANGRRVGKTVYNPPRLDAGARDDDGWNREWVTIVLDESNDVQVVRVVPDFSAARSVVALDAHPSEPVWQANTVPWMSRREVLSPEERTLWRRYERGLRVVQVGDATRPLSGDKADEWLDENRLRTLLEHLRDEFGHHFATAITTAQVEDRVEALMHEAGISSPELMHFGEEKSRNDFANEPVGLVNGCMDPGDDYVLDLLAELDLDAEVETDTDDAGDEYRARGRGFEGSDADSAEAILASVRENHIAQAAGRYARNPEDPDVTATVFVRTDAVPPGFADIQVPGVEWTFTDLQRDIVDELRNDVGSKTTREIADAVECSKEHVRQTLHRLEEDDVVQAIRDEGPNGATLYSDDGTPQSGVVDLDESPTTAYETTNRWSLAIRHPTRADQAGDQGGDTTSTTEWDWQSASDGGGPPD